MLKFGNFIKCHKYMNIVRLDLWKSYSTKYCVNYDVPASSRNSFSGKLLSDNFCLINGYRQFRTLSPNFSEESVVVETSVSETEPPIDPRKDRRTVISPETSIRYMKSRAYKTTYGDEPVWVKYRRNFKGAFIPRRTRGSCIKQGMIDTGSPCPICRDEYLVLHYTNVDLLEQFISPQTGEIRSLRKIHLCQKRLMELEVAIKKAKFYGYLTYQVPFRKYNYKEFYPALKE